MTDREDLLRLLRTLAAHPVLPPADALPANDDAFRSLLAELARGNASAHAEGLRAVSAEVRVPVDELSRRARFLLTCLLLPASGTHYEVLGVSRDATRQQIRKRWATLIQRYHPDRLGGAAAGRGWLDEQARRLIEAYHVLGDPARRLEYDAELAGGSTGGVPRPVMASPRQWTVRLAAPARWKWAPAGIVAVGLVASIWAYSRPTHQPLPRTPLPAAPKLLDRWSVDEAASGGGHVQPGKAPATRARPDGVDPVNSPAPAELPSLKGRLVPLPPANARRAPAPESSGPHMAAAPPSPIATLPPSAHLPLSTVRQGAAPVPLAHEALPPASVVRERQPTANPGGVPAEASTAAPAAPDDASVTVPQAAPPMPSPAQRPARPPQVAVSAGPTGSSVAALKPAPLSADTSSRDESLALIESFRAAYERKDLPTVMALFGANARDRDVAGRDAVEQLYVKNFAALDGIRYELIQLGLKPSSGGDLVIEGRFRIRATLVDGRQRHMDVTGPIRWLLRRESGVLRIAAVEYEASPR
jgi:ketosteroid isomerase-like protein